MAVAAMLEKAGGEILERIGAALTEAAAKKAIELIPEAIEAGDRIATWLWREGSDHAESGWRWLNRQFD
jgi:hypothetical protein